MRSIVATLLFTFVVACSPNTSNTQSSAPARFEIRDFRLEEVTSEYGSLNVSGRGTLVALDESMKKGNYLVWFTGKRSRKDEDTVTAALIMKDGLATIETSDYVTKEDRDKIKVRYSDWKMIGYVKMQEAILVQDATAPVPHK